MTKLWFQRRATAPAHFPPDFAATFNEITAALGSKATAARAVEIEAAALLLEDMRVSAPNWPADRFATLAAILRGLRT